MARWSDPVKGSSCVLLRLVSAEMERKCPGKLGPTSKSSFQIGVIIMDKSGAIDFCALERELQAAVAADEKYWRENDAKFRAVHQKVASYEEFRYRTTLADVVSCGSRSVPMRFHSTIQLRKPEVVIRSCMTPCPKKKAPKEGVLAIANLIAKLGEKPWVPKVPIQFHKQQIGSSLIISCPGARPEHAVAWDKDLAPLYRTHFLKGVNKSMRVFIDHGNHLHIQFAQLNDRGTYYCWRESQMIAGFRLSLGFQSPRKRTLNDPETRYAIKAILTSYVFITIVFIGIHLGRCCFCVFRGTFVG